jgi:uncharacterized phage protein (TIGR02218 family)
MTATIATDFQNHLKGRSHTLCWLLRLNLKDGSVIACTDHDQIIAFDLGDGSSDYRPDLGMTLSNVETGTGLDAGNYEATFPISSKAGWPFTRDAVAGGRFNRCEARLFRVNWASTGNGARKFMFGNAGQWRIEGDKAICQVRDQRDRLNQTVGEQVQNQCPADYADQIECFATPTEITLTVTAVASAMQVTGSFTGSYADGVFNRGELIGLTGANAGLAYPVWSWTAAGVVQTYWPMVDVPAIGDTFTLRDGCARTRTACMAHGQILNFRGFPDVPGQKALKPAIPNSPAGSGGKAGKG